MFRRFLSLVALPVLALAVLAVPPSDPKAIPGAPNPDAQQSATKAQVEGGLKAEVWAAEPLLANPVAFGFDELGKCYVAETTRFKNGVPDTRDYMQWLEEDIGARTVADRVAMYRKHKYVGFEGYDDHLRQVWDTDGNGTADKSTVFSSGYNRPEDGLAAGVLARKGDVYFANIPDLYRLRDTNSDGVADLKDSLSSGYGVRAQFLGHDLHGLLMGPDGKLYFSVGDRGLNVRTKEGRKLFNPDSGAVLRCDPGGANLEIVHVGLRNPQELAFDDLGNLFTYDNNSDSGDRARWVQIVEGGDSGWRCGYQYGTLMHHAGVPQGNRGPWNAEKIWHVPGPESSPPAYVVPPLLHFGNGPAGITYYPGVGLGDRYKGHFFACDFTASAGNSVIWSLAVQPKGASFEVVDLHKFVQQMVPTDCDFGPDGGFYWSDWTGGWNPPQKGRIFRVTDPTAMKNPAVAEAKRHLAEGMTKQTIPQLIPLLGHPHQKVRLEAQYELAGRNPGEAIAAFARVASRPSNTLARNHAVWGLGMLAHTSPDAFVALSQFATSTDSDTRLQVARVLSRTASLPTSCEAAVYQLIADANPATQAFAAVAMGRLGAPQAEPTRIARGVRLLDLLKTNNDEDAYVRSAAVVGLAGMSASACDPFSIWASVKSTHNTPAVRLGVVLALRRLHCDKLEAFLTDDSPLVAAEAARAIYDERVEPSMSALAVLADKPALADPIAYRALAANYKLGRPENAVRVANFAGRSTEPDHLRVCALRLLADWAKPKRLDPITGLTQDLPARSESDLVAAVRPEVAKMLAGSDAVREEAVKLVRKLNVPEVGPLLVTLLRDSARPTGVRVEAMFALDALKAKETTDAVKFALASPVPKLRAAGRVVKAKADPVAAAKELPALLNEASASAVEKQMALGVMGELKESREIDTALAAWLDRLLAGSVPAELKLDLLEAATERTLAKNLVLHAPLKAKLAAVDQAARAASDIDPLARYRETLSGGDADRGRNIFLNSAAVYCQRCHRLDGQGGDVGPVLNGIAAKHPRDYLLEAIVYPNAKTAEGYQSVILNTIDGKTVTGVLRSKDSKQYVLMTADNKMVTVPRDDVDSERPDKSAMPDDLHKKLTKRELRDVVEFLAGLREPAPK